MRRAFKIEWILGALLVMTACKSRSPTEDMSLEQNGAVDSSRVDTLEVLIEALKNQLETNQKMSESEREALEKKLAEAEAEKAKAEMNAPGSGMPIATPTPTPSSTPTPKPTATPTPTAPKLEGPYNIYYMDTQRTDCMQPFDPNNLGDGSLFRAWPCNNSEIQQWTLEIRDNGYFRLIHKMTGKCLNMEGNTGGEGTPPVMRTCQATANVSEQWKFFDAAADGSTFKLQSRLSNFCLKFGGDGTVFQGSCVNNYTDYRLKKTP
jgi:hypothetical protein